MKNDFQIFVGTFPIKTAYKNGNTIDVYQLNKIKYELAKEIDNLSKLSEVYGTSTALSYVGEDCDSGLINCSEKLVAPPPPPRCEGPPGPPGDRGPRGLKGDDAIAEPCGPCPEGPGDCPKEYCGFLPGAPPCPPADWPIRCHCEDIKGLIFRMNLSDCPFQSPNSESNVWFQYYSEDNDNVFVPGAQVGGICPTRDSETGTTFGCGASKFQYIAAGQLSSFGGLPSVSTDFSWCEYLDIVGTGNGTCGFWKPSQGNYAAGPYGKFAFFPTYDLYGFLKGPGIGNPVNYELFLNTWGQRGGAAADDLIEIKEYYPDCAGECVPPPPPADQGDLICANGVPPPSTGSCDNCPAGCPNPIQTCGGFKEGDKFVDVCNGVTYYYVNGAWGKDGIRNCGNEACKPCPPRPRPCECPPGGGGGGCDCDECGGEDCSLPPGPDGEKSPPGTLKCCAEGQECKGPTDCESECPCPECPPDGGGCPPGQSCSPDGGGPPGCPPGTSCRGPCPPPGGGSCPPETPLCCLRCSNEEPGSYFTILIGDLLYRVIGPVD